MNLKRARLLKKGRSKTGPVAYWMSRDQRVQDNWALIFATGLSDRAKAPLYVFFCLVPEFLDASPRNYAFMLEGLKQTELLLKKNCIPFFLLSGKPQEKIPDFIKKHHISTLVTDFDPLKIKRQWKDKVSYKIDIDFYEVDAHNIVPCWEASSRQEYAAYTIRPKLHKCFREFLEDFPEIKAANKNIYNNLYSAPDKKIDWDRVKKEFYLNRSSSEIKWPGPGYENGLKALDGFLDNKIYDYGSGRNDPNSGAVSGLSPYLHFGQISAQRIVLELLKLNIKEEITGSFLEEVFIRRELSDNYCFYNKYYDSFEGFPGWAKDTLNFHRKDKRTYVYKLERLENAETHDDLWNAAQKEMMQAGKMHSYMRMYWAKKILEWTMHPEEAVEYAINLNDRYELDGRDPNGYTGIAWSIGGVHDRAWNERPIFGKIRYMSYEGCKRKFDIKSYIKRINNL